jgi:hypothetical protein
MTEDIARDPEPEAAGPITARARPADLEGAGGSAPIAPARPRDKVIAAIVATAAASKLKAWHSDVEVREIGEAWLKSEGCRRMPGGSTWRREIPKLRRLWRSEQD